jgi:putative endopeptidase
VGKAIKTESLATWKDYLKLRAIDSFSPYLSAAFVSEQFDFYGRTLSGTPQLKPRWKRARRCRISTTSPKSTCAHCIPPLK